jgi:TolB-like protein/Flp pilus assembly protein TadD
VTFDFSRFLEELKRRKVYRVAVAYAVVGFVVWQAAEIAFPAMNLPDTALTFVVAVTLLGFPIAIVLAWAFEITPEGVKKTESAPDASGTHPPAHPGVAPVAGVEPATHMHAAAPAAATPAAATPASHAPSPPGRGSIAVLPFADLSPEKDQEYFCDGMAEELMNALTKVRNLHVAARTSSFQFKGRSEDVREIGRQLHVTSVLEGSVRRAGDLLRVTAQLVNTEDGYHLWSETYERELKDVFAIQDEIARSIVDALKVQLDVKASPHLVTQATGSLEAYGLYLKGRYVFNKYRREDLGQSLTFYQQALEADPEYARAYAGIADSWMSLADDWLAPEEAYPQAKEAAERAIELDSSLAEAHSAIGKVLGWFDWDFSGAELALRRAVAQSPSYAEAHYGLASVLPPTGKMDEALVEIQEALALDPLSSEYSAWVARFLLYAGQYEDAINQCRDTIRLDPHYYYAHVREGNALLAMGRADEALHAFREQATRTADVISIRAYEAQALAVLGRVDEATELLQGLEQDERYVRPEFMAAAYGALGDLDRSFAVLEGALAVRSAGLIYLHVDPSYEPLRGDPRYVSLIERIGLITG